MNSKIFEKEFNSQSPHLHISSGSFFERDIARQLGVISAF